MAENKITLKIPLESGQQAIVEIPASIRIEDIPQPPSIGRQKPTALIADYWDNAKAGITRMFEFWIPKWIEQQKASKRPDELFGLGGHLNYDGCWVMHWLGQQLDMPSGIEGARILMDEWVAPYATSRPNSVAPGYFNYNLGPASMSKSGLYEQGSRKVYADVATRFAMHSAFSRPSVINRVKWPYGPQQARELANGLLAHIHIPGEAPEGSLDYREACAVALLDTHIPEWIDILNRRDPEEMASLESNMAPFIMALVARSLIAYGEDITFVVQRLSGLADAIYHRGLWRTNENGSGFVYRLELDRETGVPVNDPNPAADLGLMVFPLFAWLWKQTGEKRYADIAEQLFELGVRHAWLIGFKQFNQSYLWSHEGIKWMGWL